ncbi:MAG: sugar phosphate nucleotidyltransferase, partial [Acidobacteriota bacterium]
MKALILAGGSGTRFWPLSRRRRPKQLLGLDQGISLLRSTVDRLAPLIEPDDVWICTTELLADAIRAELPDVPARQVLDQRRQPVDGRAQQRNALVEAEQLFR